jgi:tRNA G46 methylase TrmB
LMEQTIPLNDSSREGFLITLTALLKGYFMSSAFRKAHELYQKIIRVTGGRVGSRTLDTYLRGCLKTGAFDEGLNAFKFPKTQKSEMSRVYAGKMLSTRLAVKSAFETGGSDDASLCVHIGSAYVRLGKLEKAREWFNMGKELLFTSAPERQFDKLQKSELVRICDFFSDDSQKGSSTSSGLDTYIERFIVISGDSSEQLQIWNALGFAKFRSEAEMQSLSEQALTRLRETVSESGRRVVLEVCSGSGEWICREASKNRDILYIASEFRFDRCVDILTRQMYQQLDNLWILCGDARDIANIIPEKSVEDLYVNYPEPPPVNVVHIEEAMSSDIVTKKFLRDIRGLITGQLHIVSDDKLYIHSVANLVGDIWNLEVFPKSSKTLVDSYFARFFSKKAKRWSIDVSPPS